MSGTDDFHVIEINLPLKERREQFSLKIDGQEIRGIVSINIFSSARDVPRVTIELIPKLVKGSIEGKLIKEEREICPNCGAILELEHVGPVENPEHGFWYWCRCGFRERKKSGGGIE